MVRGVSGRARFQFGLGNPVAADEIMPTGRAAFMSLGWHIAVSIMGRPDQARADGIGRCWAFQSL